MRRSLAAPFLMRPVAHPSNPWSSSHVESLGFGAGTDCERRIVVKHNTPELLRWQLRKPRFGSRMRGEGARWQRMVDLFQRTAQRLGMQLGGSTGAAGEHFVPAGRVVPAGPSPFRRPHQQQSLFGQGELA